VSSGAVAGGIERDRQRRSAPNGIWGMVLFLCAEVALFGTLIGAYFYLNFNSRQWPPPGIKPPEVVLPLLATAWLLATMLPVRWGAREAMAGRRWVAVRWIAAGLVMQGVYLAGQILLFIHDYNQFRPQGSAYGSIYYTLLVAHHAHVLFGMLLDLAIMWKLARRGLTDYWLIAVRGLALYWYVVGGLGVVVVFTQLAPSL
jgi:cytochrome c oxidase subunit 3